MAVIPVILRLPAAALMSSKHSDFCTVPCTQIQRSIPVQEVDELQSSTTVLHSATLTYLSIPSHMKIQSSTY